MAVGNAPSWGIQPSEFWKMVPDEWWCMFDFRRTDRPYGISLSEDEIKELYDLITVKDQ